MTGDFQNAATPSIGAYATMTCSCDAGVPHLRAGLSLQQPSGSWTNGLGYDAVKRLQSVVSPAGTFTYTYNGPGYIWTNLALPLAGAHVGKSLDSVARLNSTALVSYWGTNLNFHGYTNNVANQRIAQVRTDNSYVVYGYDNDGQLQSAVGSGGQSTENLGYQYDVCQNLKTRTNGTPTAFTVDTLHQLTGGPTSPYGYDSNGNQTGTNNCTYGYDGSDRMTSITSGTAYQTLFTYDGLGRLRIRQDNTWNGSSWVMSSQTWYLYDGRRIIQERDGTNTPQVSYTRGVDLGGSLESAGGIGGLLARSSGYSGGLWSTHYYYHADGNGNVTCLISASQVVTAAYRYDPFGNTFASSGGLASANVYRFSSKMVDRNSGIYYYGYRHYDPNLQRWLNRDPIGERGGINLYGFVGNDPLSKVDGTGLLVGRCGRAHLLPDDSSDNCLQNCLTIWRSTCKLGPAIADHAIQHVGFSVSTGAWGVAAAISAAANPVAAIGFGVVTLVIGIVEIHEVVLTVDDVEAAALRARNEFGRCVARCGREWNATEEAQDFWDTWKGSLPGTTKHK